MRQAQWNAWHFSAEMSPVFLRDNVINSDFVSEEKQAERFALNAGNNGYRRSGNANVRGFYEA